MMPLGLTTLILLVAPADEGLATIPALDSSLDFRVSYSEEPLITLSLQEDSPSDPIEAAPAEFGAEGSTRWTTQASFASHEQENFFYGVGFGIDHFYRDDISIHAQFLGVYVDQEGDDAVGGNFNLLFRWHFRTGDTWTAYIEGGAGILWMTEDVPPVGSDFNFTPQAAFGMTFALNDHARLYASVGWHHISNAGLSDPNPGRDSVSLSIGLSVPF